MSRPVELSVLMPVHNGERHLRHAIESILEQSFGDFEFIVVDDASTDASPDLLDEYARQDRRIRLTTLAEQAGVAGALNAGLEVASGSLIARMDADDIAYRSRFEVQLEEMRRDPATGLLGTQVRLVDDDANADPRFDWLLPTTHDGCVWQLLFGAPFCHPTVMMRTDVVRALHGYDVRFLNEDMELWMRMAFVTKMRNLDTELLDYRLSSVADDSEKSARLTLQSREVGRLHAERILGRPVAEGVIRALQHHRSTGAIDPTATDFEALAASSLARELFEQLTRQGVLDGGGGVAELLAEECQHREAAVFARAARHA